ncbi:hypothetical protein U9M48_039081 [Paspalum notatum var. saurae]|uniref:Uncharacterized protein n=1 Tax=Paspalum notatum var. saurae TaxID=547442 RepID=A0AAQ3UKM8_PASNO
MRPRPTALRRYPRYLAPALRRHHRRLSRPLPFARLCAALTLRHHRRMLPACARSNPPHSLPRARLLSLTCAASLHPPAAAPAPSPLAPLVPPGLRARALSHHVAPLSALLHLLLRSSPRSPVPRHHHAVVMGRMIRVGPAGCEAIVVALWLSCSRAAESRGCGEAVGGDGDCALTTSWMATSQFSALLGLKASAKKTHIVAGYLSFHGWSSQYEQAINPM